MHTQSKPTNSETIQRCFDLHDALQRKELHFKCRRESEERMHQLHRFEQPSQRSKSYVSFQTEACHQHDCFKSWKSKKASNTCTTFMSSSIKRHQKKKKLQGSHSSLSLGGKVDRPPRITSHPLSIYFQPNGSIDSIGTLACLQGCCNFASP